MKTRITQKKWGLSPKKLAAIITIFAFLLTQCGLGIAGPIYQAKSRSDFAQSCEAHTSYNTVEGVAGKESQPQNLRPTAKAQANGGTKDLVQELGVPAVTYAEVEIWSDAALLEQANYGYAYVRIVAPPDFTQEEVAEINNIYLDHLMPMGTGYRLISPEDRDKLVKFLVKYLNILPANQAATTTNLASGRAAGNAKAVGANSGGIFLPSEVTYAISAEEALRWLHAKDSAVSLDYAEARRTPDGLPLVIVKDGIFNKAVTPKVLREYCGSNSLKIAYEPSFAPVYHGGRNRAWVGPSRVITSLLASSASRATGAAATGKKKVFVYSPKDDTDPGDYPDKAKVVAAVNHYAALLQRYDERTAGLTQFNTLSAARNLMAQAIVSAGFITQKAASDEFWRRAPLIEYDNDERQLIALSIMRALPSAQAQLTEEWKTKIRGVLGQLRSPILEYAKYQGWTEVIKNYDTILDQPGTLGATYDFLYNIATQFDFMFITGREQYEAALTEFRSILNELNVIIHAADSGAVAAEIRRLGADKVRRVSVWDLTVKPAPKRRSLGIRQLETVVGEGKVKFAFDRWYMVSVSAASRATRGMSRVNVWSDEFGRTFGGCTVTTERVGKVSFLIKVYDKKPPYEGSIEYRYTVNIGHTKRGKGPQPTPVEFDPSIWTKGATTLDKIYEYLPRYNPKSQKITITKGYPNWVKSLEIFPITRIDAAKFELVVAKLIYAINLKLHGKHYANTHDIKAATKKIRLETGRATGAAAVGYKKITRNNADKVLQHGTMIRERLKGKQPSKFMEFVVEELTWSSVECYHFGDPLSRASFSREVIFQDEDGFWQYKAPTSEDKRREMSLLAQLRNEFTDDWSPLNKKRVLDRIKELESELVGAEQPIAGNAAAVDSKAGQVMNPEFVTRGDAAGTEEGVLPGPLAVAGTNDALGLTEEPVSRIGGVGEDGATNQQYVGYIPPMTPEATAAIREGVQRSVDEVLTGNVVEPAVTTSGIADRNSGTHTKEPYVGYTPVVPPAVADVVTSSVVNYSDLDKLYSDIEVWLRTNVDNPNSIEARKDVNRIAEALNVPAHKVIAAIQNMGFRLVPGVISVWERAPFTSSAEAAGRAAGAAAVGMVQEVLDIINLGEIKTVLFVAPSAPSEPITISDETMTQIADLLKQIARRGVNYVEYYYKESGEQLEIHPYEGATAGAAGVSPEIIKQNLRAWVVKAQTKQGVSGVILDGFPNISSRMVMRDTPKLIQDYIEELLNGLPGGAKLLLQEDSNPKFVKLTLVSGIDEAVASTPVGTQIAEQTAAAEVAPARVDLGASEARTVAMKTAIKAQKPAKMQVLLIGDATDLDKRITEKGLSDKVTIDTATEVEADEKGLRDKYEWVIVRNGAIYQLEKAVQGIALGDYDIEGIVDRIAAQAASAGVGV